MASPSRSAEREEERRSHIRTLVIASAASATAAVVTSKLWIAGTWIAAALTPVLVALISELLHRPTQVLAERLTTDRPPLPEAAGPAPPAEPQAHRLPDRAPPEPEAAPVRVYRSSPMPKRRKIAVGAVVGTGVLAMLIAVVALTVPELIAGGAIGKSGSTTFFSNSHRSNPKPTATPPPSKQQPSKTDQQQPTNTGAQPPATQPTTGQPPPQQTTPAAPPASTTPGTPPSQP
jgi:hypothetical protein